MLTNTIPRPGDTENLLLQKILQRLGGIPRPGDLDTDLIRKIAEEKGGSVFPGDSKNMRYRRLAQAMGVRTFPGDDTNKLLYRLVQAVGANPSPGDTDAILLRKFVVLGNQPPTLTPGLSGGDLEIVVTLNDPLWIGMWLGFWVSFTDPGVDPVGSDFQFQNVVEITSVPFTFSVVFPVPPFSPAQVCIMITTGTSQSAASDGSNLDEMAEDHRQNCVLYPNNFGSPPAPPVAIAATDIDDASFTANWNASVDATSYRLDVSTDVGFGSFVPGFNDLNVGNVTSFSVGGLSASTTYHYRVRAVNDAGASASSNVISLATLAYNPQFPDTIPNLLAWWKADSLSLADGTAVGAAGTEWLDQKGTNDLTQGTAANRPVFKVNIVNGMPVIRFDGINDFLNMASEIVLGSSWTWMVVLSKSAGGGGQISIGGSANGDGFEHNFVNSKGCRVISAAGASNNAVFTAAETVWKCANAIAEVSGGGDTNVYENKTQRNPALAVIQIPTVNVIGQRSGGSFLDGDIAEILIYSDNLTLAQRDSVIDDYLQVKYALVI